MDRNGTVLASVKPELVVTAKPGIVLKQPWVLAKLSALISVPEDKLLEKVKAAAWRPQLAATIFVGASVEAATRIAEAGEMLPGIGVETQPMRVYADTVDFSHILGYVWTPSAKDVERLGTPAEYVGKIGVEYIYERFLMGQPGEESMESNSKGKALRIIGRTNPKPGDRIVLTVDAKLQHMAAELLRGVLSDYGAPGAIVALDPRNGEVLCLASSPTYDTKIFRGGITSAEWKALQGDPMHPLTNRAIYGSYAPGSTFKVITSLAAEQAGLFNLNRTITCPGYYEVGNRKFKCEGQHGSISFHRAFEKSCNTYFYGLGIASGAEAIREAAQSAGLGAKTGIDLLGEGRGLVPTESWLRAVQHLKPDEKPRWYTGDTANISIGQGDVLATPLQMACVASMVANDGTIYKPHLLKSRSPFGGGRPVSLGDPEILSKVDASTQFWRSIKSAMVSVVESGTATGGTQIPGVRWGGKTGSSQHKKGTKTHSWFIGVAPMDDPKIVIAVLVESAGHGGEVAAPMAANIIRQWLLRDQKADANAAASESARSDASANPIER